MPSVTCACQGCGCEQVRCRIERCDQSSSECSSAVVYWQPRHTSLGHLSAWIPVWSNVEQKAFKSVVSSGDFIVKHPHILGFHKDPGFGHAHHLLHPRPFHHVSCFPLSNHLQDHNLRPKLSNFDRVLHRSDSTCFHFDMKECFQYMNTKE